jgi:hypothetical protein
MTFPEKSNEEEHEESLMIRRNVISIWLGMIALAGTSVLALSACCVDNDGDGYGAGGPGPSICAHTELDCNDTDPNVHPGAVEGPYGDPTCSDGLDNDCNGLADNAFEPTCNPDDLNMTAADFECILRWTKVSPYYLTNKRGYLTEALAVANSPTGGTFPPGTIIQLFPTEAVVKRAPGWNPTTNDWEYFRLVVSQGGTQIATRGAENTVNQFGGNCFACHRKAAPQWDLICDDNHGCDPLPAFVDDAFIVAAQQADPRCP